MMSRRPNTALPDEEAECDGDLRVIDENGEDHLLSADRFVAIEVAAAVRASNLKRWDARRRKRVVADSHGSKAESR